MLPTIVNKIFFHGRLRQSFLGRINQIFLGMQGCAVGVGTRLPRSIWINWPNQLSIGRDCVIQNDVFMDYCHGVPLPGPNILIGDRTFIGRYCEFNITESIRIGNDCLIASGCKFIDHDHGMALSAPMSKQPQHHGPIIIEDEVWLGVNSVVLKGVTIGKGAIVGAGAVLTKSVPALEIWAGVPARQIGSRLEKTSTTPPVAALPNIAAEQACGSR